MDEEMEALTEDTVLKLQYLFGISKFEIFQEVAIWQQMDQEDRDGYEDDFSWYLSSKYQIKEAF